MKDIVTFQFRPTSTNSGDDDHRDWIDILSWPSSGVEYEYKFEDIMISSMDTSGAEAAMLLPAVQSVREHSVETSMWDDFLLG